MKSKTVSVAVTLLLATLASRSLRAQDEKPRVWYDLKVGVAFESPGGTTYGNATAGALSVAASRELTKSFAIQLAGDYFTQVFASSGSCGISPGNGGCIVGVTHKNFNTIGAAASLVLTSGEDHAPRTDASLGVGYYSVGGEASNSSVGFRATVNRTLSTAKREELSIHGGVLILPIGSGSPVSIITVGLGLRVW